MYEKTLYAGWGDIDFNGHMKNTAFLDKSADVRMMVFSESGFSVREFSKLSMGPVVMKDEVEYIKEIELLQEARVTLALAGLSEDGSRFLMRNEFYHANGILAASVTTLGGWLDLRGRCLISPPASLLQVLQSLPRTPDFTCLPSSLRDRQTDSPMKSTAISIVAPTGN
jgi:acyl-CoA thioester hydrolase